MYKHVLVAVDLSDESEFLLKKAVGIAKRNDAQLSIIHVDVNFSDLYTGLIDVNMSSMQDRISSETQKALINLAEHAGYPIKEKLKKMLLLLFSVFPNILFSAPPLFQPAFSKMIWTILWCPAISQKWRLKGRKRSRLTKHRRQSQSYLKKLPI